MARNAIQLEGGSDPSNRRDKCDAAAGIRSEQSECHATKSVDSFDGSVSFIESWHKSKQNAEQFRYSIVAFLHVNRSAANGDDDEKCV